MPGAVTYRVSVASGAAGGGVDAPGGVISKGALAWNDNGGPITTVEHEPRRLGVAAPGHVLLAGRAGRRRGQCRRAVRDLLVRVALARHDHADGHRHGAGRGDLRPALPVGPDSGRRQLRDGDQHDLGLRDRLQAVLAPRPTATSFAPSATLPNNTYYWRVRGLDSQGQAGPWNNGPTFDKTYDQTAVPGPPNLTRAATRSSSRSRPAATSTSRSSRGRRSPARATTRCRWPAVERRRRSTPRRTPPGRRSPRPAARASRSSSARPNVQRRARSTALLTGDTCTCPCAPSPTTRSTARRSPGRTRLTSFHVGGEAFNNPPTADCTVAAVAAPGGSTPAPTSSRPASGGIVSKSPLICWKPADMNPGVGVNAQQRLLGRHRARLQLHDGRAGGVHRRAVLRAAVAARRRGHALLLAGHPDGRRTAAATRPRRGAAGRLHGLAELPARVGAADADPARRRRRRLRAPSCSSGARCRSRSRTTRSRSRRTTRSARILESATTDATAYSATHDLPGRSDGLLARARQQRRQQGPRLVGHVELRADAARADDHDGAAVPRARRSRRSPGRRSTARPATRCRTCGPTRACT